MITSRNSSKEGCLWSDLRFSFIFVCLYLRSHAHSFFFNIAFSFFFERASVCIATSKSSSTQNSSSDSTCSVFCRVGRPVRGHLCPFKLPCRGKKRGSQKHGTNERKSPPGKFQTGRSARLRTPFIRFVYFCNPRRGFSKQNKTSKSHRKSRVLCKSEMTPMYLSHS